MGMNDFSNVKAAGQAIVANLLGEKGRVTSQ
jgi:hypothetical protein